MDKLDRGKQDWGWLPAQMPGVAKLIKDKKTEVGDKHVNLCWKRGVLEKQPGWFFAREGALAVGTPWNDDPTLANFAALAVNGAALLILRPVETSHGA